MSAWASLLQGPLNVLDQGLQELQSARYLIGTSYFFILKLRNRDIIADRYLLRAPSYRSNIAAV